MEYLLGGTTVTGRIETVDLCTGCTGGASEEREIDMDSIPRDIAGSSVATNAKPKTLPALGMDVH